MRDFNYTVNVLVQAYLNDTLSHSTCGCAVHNIIQSKYPYPVDSYWTDVFATVIFGGRYFRLCNYKGIAKTQIDETGYTVYELSDIEYAFEKDRQLDDVFKCLMNVVDVLADIHGIDLTQKEEAKKLFQKL